MLSFLCVILAVASVSAITIDDFSSMVVPDTDTTPATLEGYNYKQRVYVDTSSLADGQTLGTVSWEITPSYDWLKVRPGSDDKNIIIEGVLPAYKADTTEYTLHVIAHVSGDVPVLDADGNISQDEEGNDIYVSGDISADVDGMGLTITVDEDTTTVGVFPEMLTISYDASAVESLDVTDIARSKYSVRIIFKTSADQVPEYVYYTDEYGNKAISQDENYENITTGNLKDGNIHVLLQIDASDPETLAGYINLPSWLAYEVVSSQDTYTYYEDTDELTPDGNNFIKELRIFYSSDHDPQDGEKGTIRITGGQYDYDYTALVDPDNTKYANDPTIGWTVAYSVVPPISLDKYELEVSPDCDVSVDLTVNYTEQHPVSIDFTPDISANVKLSADWTEANTTEANSINPSGVITVNVEPVTIADATYSTDMIVTDTNGKTATAHITVNVVVPSIVVDPSQDVKLISAYNGSADKAITWSRVKPTGYTYSPDIASGFGFAVTSDDSTITLSIAPTISDDWKGTLTILDAYGKSADISLYLHGVVSGDIETSISSAAPSGTITAGDSFTVTLSAGNTYGTTSWVAAVNGFTVSPTSTTGSTATFTFTAPTGKYGTFSADITATDQSGREKHYTFSNTVVLPRMVISGDFAAVSVIYPESGSADVEFYDAAPVSWEVSPQISADIEVTSDDERITVTLTPTATESATYETVIYFTDENGYVTSKDLTFEVVVPVIAITPTSITIDAANSATGWTGTGTLSYTSADPVSYTPSPEVPSGFRFTVTSGDGTITLTINPDVSFIYSDYPVTTKRYDGTLTFTDAYGGTAAVTVRLQASDPSLFSISGTAPTMTLTAGDSGTMNFTSRNSKNNSVTWVVSPTSSNGVTASISPTSTTTGATLTVNAAESATAGSVKLTVTANDNLIGGISLPASYDVTVTVNAKTTPTPGGESGDPTPVDPTPVDPTPGGESIVDKDPGLVTLVSENYITSDGTITSKAFTSDSDSPSSSFHESGNILRKHLVMAFRVSVWYIYLGGTPYGPFRLSSFGATADGPVTVTPDSSNNAAATVEIDRTKISGQNVDVDLGVIPTSSTNGTIVTTNIGSVSSSSGSTTNALGAAGGGCASGFGAVVLALAAFVIRKKR